MQAKCPFSDTQVAIGRSNWPECAPKCVHERKLEVNSMNIWRNWQLSRRSELCPTRDGESKERRRAQQATRHCQEWTSLTQEKAPARHASPKQLEGHRTSVPITYCITYRGGKARRQLLGNSKASTVEGKCRQAMWGKRERSQSIEVRMTVVSTRYRTGQSNGVWKEK